MKKHLTIKIIIFFLIFNLISKIGAVNAQNTTPILDYVSINNDIVDTSNGKQITVSLDDAVKIAGRGKPGQAITIIFANQKISTTIDQNGNWFVLFSITNLNTTNYPIKIEIDNSIETIPLIELKVEKNITTPTQNSNIIKTNGPPSEKKSPSALPLMLILSILFLILLYKKIGNNR